MSREAEVSGMQKVRLRFVCSHAAHYRDGNAAPRERTLQTVVYLPPESDPAIAAGRPHRDGREGVYNLLWGPAKRLGSGPDQADRRDNRPSANRNEFAGHVRAIGGDDESIPEVRMLLDCPHCPPRIVLSEAKAIAIGRKYRHVGGTVTIDVSTGAILHKQ